MNAAEPSRARKRALLLGTLVSIALVFAIAHWTRWPGLPFKGNEALAWNACVALVFGLLSIANLLVRSKRMSPASLAIQSLATSYISGVVAYFVAQLPLGYALARLSNSASAHPLALLVVIFVSPLVTGAWVYGLASMAAQMFVARPAKQP